MLQAIGNSGQFALRCFLSELGDKTFFVTVLLAAWVATWHDANRGWQQRQHQLMVFTGASAAFLLHAVLTSFHAVSLFASSALNATGVLLLIALGIRLHIELQQSHAGASEAKDAILHRQSEEQFNNWNPLAAQVPASSAATRTSWNMFGIIPPEGHGSYGSLAHSSMPDWAKESPKSAQAADTPSWSLLSAGFVSFVLIFCLEVGNRSQYDFLIAGETLGIQLVASAMIGYIFATFLAVCIGYVMEATTQDAWLMFAAELVFFAMALHCLSQACLLAAPVAVKQTAVLLGLRSVVAAGGVPVA